MHVSPSINVHMYTVTYVALPLCVFGGSSGYVAGFLLRKKAQQKCFDPDARSVYFCTNKVPSFDWNVVVPNGKIYDRIVLLLLHRQAVARLTLCAFYSTWVWLTKAIWLCYCSRFPCVPRSVAAYLSDLAFFFFFATFWTWTALWRRRRSGPIVSRRCWRTRGGRGTPSASACNTTSTARRSSSTWVFVVVVDLAMSTCMPANSYSRTCMLACYFSTVHKLVLFR